MQVLPPSRFHYQKQRRFSFFAVHLALPILLGGVIYVCWREPNLLMFTWLRALGLESIVERLRFLAAPARNFIPHWMIYSLPDGLWVYALTAFTLLVWRDTDSSWMRVLWCSLGFLLGAGIELGQLAGIVPGTFDYGDLIVCLIAPAAALLFTSRKLVFSKLILRESE